MNIASRLKSFFTGRADISIFHDFVPPPYGGGNQFLLALKTCFEELGYAVESNAISKSSKACLFNSYNFDFNKLRSYRAKRPECRMVHRVDGPIGVYRGFDDGTDEKIRAINEEISDATVFQSEYSLNKHQELGIELKNPTVIMNSPNPNIFNAENKAGFSEKGKVKIVSSSWSSNPKKGAAVYKWLDGNLDFLKYEYTFVGNTKEKFKNIKVVTPLPSKELALLLKENDIFITASMDDPCSNALIEALSCGLPSIYLKSGGHPEIVRDGGLGFFDCEEVPEALNQVVSNYKSYQSKILAPHIRDVAEKYLKVMGLSKV